MAQKITMYPTGVSQPNRNQSSGLQGKCFSKAVTRGGGTYGISCKTQKDPKYHHEWSNAEEILKGNTIQCGRPSTRMCSHETYYDIKGYRNTCPIAGVNGTYTQPATLRLSFDLSKKGVSSSAKIEKVEISFEHRCTGVDVANGREYTHWGPNFNGFNVYPSRKPLTIKVGSESQVINSNPPLSSKFSSIGKLIFKKVTYNDLKNGIDVIYGNNLETNPGNIYLKNFSINVYYTDGEPYISGSQNKKDLYISDVETCRSSITFTIEAGYKQGKTKIPISQAPKNLRKDIKVTKGKNVSITYKDDTKDKRKRIYTLIDNSNEAGKKTVKFTVAKKEISFNYEAKKRNKPEISVPNQIERNTKSSTITSIVAKNGCAKEIKAYDNKINNDSLIYTFTNLNNSNKENIIPVSQINDFYNELASLSCGLHDLYFKRDNESNDNVVHKVIEIIPTKYKFKITEVSDDIELSRYETSQNKEENKTLKLTYIKTKELINPPKFIIENPTHGKLSSNKPTKELIDNEPWEDISLTNPETSKNITIGTYYPGEYTIQVKDKESTCAGFPFTFKVNITPKHKQYFDEIFIRGEDSTAFNYDYLVALEGDSITEPVYVDNVKLGASFNDIKICVKKNNSCGLTEIEYIPMKITNTSQNSIKDLLLELNTLLKDEEDIIHVTSNEWLESDGIFYNFKENFEKYNSELTHFVSIKNLTTDDDNTDEEDVYIHIQEIQPNEQIEVKIPFGCSIEKEVFLQILLFGQPIILYPIGNCSNDMEIFDKISMRVYDSILTDMRISGETDLFEMEVVGQCPNECFKTSTGITYSIKNIDTNSLEAEAETIIINDPRLVPYMFKYKKNGVVKEYALDNYDEINGIIKFNRNENAYRVAPISGARIDAYVQFEEHKEIHFHRYTDYQGETIFNIPIPRTVGESYTIEELLKHMSIEYSGGESYSGKRYISENSLYVNDGTRTIYANPFKNSVSITPYFNSIKYYPGQVVPLKIKLEGQSKYIQNEIMFKPQIRTPGTTDSVTVYYQICNLEGNKGKLATKFKTNSYHFIPNEVSKKIYCGVNTNTELYTKLSKVIVENKTLNRLYMTLENKDRDNKNITITIEENMEIEKYDVIDYEVDRGVITNNNGQIIWDIDYIEEDATIRGHIDFKAKEVGYSILEGKVVDFIDKMEKEPKFGKNLSKCECRDVNDQD